VNRKLWKEEEENLTIFVHRGLAKDFAGIIDKLLTELFGEFIGFAFGRIATVDVVLHVLEHVRISTVKEGNAASGDLTIDCRQTAEDDIIHSRRAS